MLSKKSNSLDELLLLIKKNQKQSLVNITNNLKTNLKSTTNIKVWATYYPIETLVASIFSGICIGSHISQTVVIQGGLRQKRLNKISNEAKFAPTQNNPIFISRSLTKMGVSLLEHVSLLWLLVRSKEERDAATIVRSLILFGYTGTSRIPLSADLIKCFKN